MALFSNFKFFSRNVALLSVFLLFVVCLTPVGSDIWSLFVRNIVGPDESKSSDNVLHWTNFWTAVTALATVGLFFSVFLQINAARSDRRGWETLATCERYDSDPIIDICSRNLKTAKDNGDLAAAPLKYSLDAITILNYLEGIAIGIELMVCPH